MKDPQTKKVPRPNKNQQPKKNYQTENGRKTEKAFKALKTKRNSGGKLNYLFGSIRRKKFYFLSHSMPPMPLQTFHAFHAASCIFKYSRLGQTS